jgi:hypothetical protein
MPRSGKTESRTLYDIEGRPNIVPFSLEAEATEKIEPGLKWTQNYSQGHAPASLQWKTSWTVIHSHLIKQLGWSFLISQTCVTVSGSPEDNSDEDATTLVLILAFLAANGGNQ